MPSRPITSAHFTMTVLVKSEGACHGLAEQEEIFPQLSAVDVTSIMFDSI